MLYTSIYPKLQSSLSSIDNRAFSKESSRIKYPEEIQAIIRCDRANYGNLYLSNIEAAENLSLLSNLQITSILSVARGFTPSHPQQSIRYHKCIPIQDRQDAGIHQYLDESIEFISEKLLFTNVLIHCVSGVGRSACFAIAYLMKAKKMDFEEAFREVKSRRKLVHLSDSMIQQLQKYGLDLMNQGLSRKKYSLSVRANSNHNISEISPSYFKEKSVDDGSILAELYTNKDRIIEFDDEGERRSQKSYNFEKSSERPSSIKSKDKAMKTENPEERAPKFNDLPDFCPSFTKKKSSSRQDFQKKVSLVDSRNEEINRSLISIQQKYENELKASRLTFQRSVKKQAPICELSEPSEYKHGLFKGLLE